MASNLDFKGTYYYESTHTPAVNPILRLKDVGRVGLPLSEPAAKRIISHCRQAPFGQGERTVVDTTVRDTWEMDAVDVSYRTLIWKCSYFESYLGAIRQSGMGDLRGWGREGRVFGARSQRRAQQTTL